MVIRVKFHIPVHLSSLIPKMLMITLAISCLTPSNLPWFTLIHRPNIPGPYAIVLFTALDLASITLHIHNWVLLLIWFHLFIFSVIISPKTSSSMLGTTDLGSSSFSVLPFCIFILFMGFSRQEYWSGLPFPSPVDHILSELSTMTHLSWVALHSMVHSFNELEKAVVHMIRLVSFLWLWFLSVTPLMPSLRANHLTGISLMLDLGYLLLASAPDLGCGYPCMAPTLNFGHGISPLRGSQLQHHAAAAPHI